jgi:hypothetical protein
MPRDTPPEWAFTDVPSASARIRAFLRTSSSTVIVRFAMGASVLHGSVWHGPTKLGHIGNDHILIQRVPVRALVIAPLIR